MEVEEEAWSELIFAPMDVDLPSCEDDGGRLPFPSWLVDGQFETEYIQMWVFFHFCFLCSSWSRSFSFSPSFSVALETSRRTGWWNCVADLAYLTLETWQCSGSDWRSSVEVEKNGTGMCIPPSPWCFVRYHLLPCTDLLSMPGMLTSAPEMAETPHQNPKKSQLSATKWCSKTQQHLLLIPFHHAVSPPSPPLLCQKSVTLSMLLSFSGYDDISPFPPLIYRTDMMQSHCGHWLIKTPDKVWWYLEWIHNLDRLKTGAFIWNKFKI